MLGASFAMLNADFGFSLALAEARRTSSAIGASCDLIERNYVQYLGLTPGAAPVAARASWSSSGACCCRGCASCSRARAASSSCGTRPPRPRSTRSCANGGAPSGGAARRCERIQGAAGELERRLAEFEAQDARLHAVPASA